MINSLTFTIGCLLLLIGSIEGLTEEEWVKRIYAHQILEDHLSTCTESKAGLLEWPQSRKLWETRIKAFSEMGDEKGMLNLFKQYVEKFENPYGNRDLLESMAWGVIRKGIASSYPNVRLMALLGAFFSQDAKGIELVAKCLKDQNSLVRGAAVQLSSHLRDAKLIDGVLQCFQTDKIWGVRLEAIRAIGAMKIKEGKEELVHIVSNSKSTAEEKAVAIQSLVNLLDTAEREEVKQLAASDRTGLRLLACEVVDHFDLYCDIDLIFPLLKDYHTDVRAAAIHTIGSLRIQEFDGTSVTDHLEPLLADPDTTVALTATWAMTLYEPERGCDVFAKWINHRSVHTARIAAALLAATGKYGTSMMSRLFFEAKDPFVKMNLALGLINQRAETAKACECIYQTITSSNERWMWKDYPFFRVLAPSQMQGTLLQHPEEINQLARLDILNILAIMKDPHANDAIKHYLKKKQWGITGLASTLLLTEGDEAAIDLVQEMMLDVDPQVRFQAALIVALWGRGESAIQLLQEAYPVSSRETKEKILEGLGRVGSQSSIPFLTNQLQESAQSLRLIAAATLLQCLYH